jgi:hypothetical protein
VDEESAESDDESPLGIDSMASVDSMVYMVSPVLVSSEGVVSSSLRRARRLDASH